MDESALDEWMRRRALGELVRRLRENAGMNQPELANTAVIPQSAVSQIENGRRSVGPDVARALDDALDAKGSLMLAARDTVWGPIDPGIERSAYAILEGLVQEGPASGDQPEVSSTERREFFGMSSGLAAGAVVGPHLLDNALERGSVSQGRLEWIENETQQIAHSVFRVPDPQPLLRPAMEQYTIITSLLNEPQRTPDRRRLSRAAANICGSLGAIHRNALDDPGGARSWLRTARAAALDAGDPFLSDAVLVYSLYPDLYSGNARRVLTHLSPRLDANARPNQSLAKSHGLAARAHAIVGDKDAVRRHLASAQEILDRSPEPDIEAWEGGYFPAQLAFHAANAANLLGDTRRAIESADWAAERFEDGWVDKYNVRFDKAIALHKAGEVDEACRVATEVITDPDMPEMNFGLRGYAKRFDRRLGTATTGPVTDWRDAYHDRLPTEPA